MKIYHRPTGREAEMRSGKYLCFPPGSNEIKDSKSFSTIEEAAVFLIKNPKWKIWLKGNSGSNDGQLNSDLVIEGAFDLRLFL